MRKSFCNRVNNLKGREGWSAFLGTNHFNNLQSLIVEAILISTGSESAFIFPSMAAMNFHREFAGPERSCGFDSRPGTNDVNSFTDTRRLNLNSHNGVMSRVFATAPSELPAKIARQSNPRRRFTSALGHQR